MVSLKADKFDFDTCDLLQSSAVDVTGAANVEVSWKEDKSVLWVNVNGVCLLRICRIEQLTVQNT